MRRVGTLSVLLALSTFASAATAGEAATPVTPPDAAVVEAREAFRRGSTLARSGDWEAALQAFQQSERLKPHPVTMYDVAYCERALGHYARASFRFAEALAAPADGNAPLPADLTRDATTYLAEVRARVARVTVTVRRQVLTIRVDGKPLERMEPGEHAVYAVSARDDTGPPMLPGVFELWLDPGTHVFVSSGSFDAHSVESRTFAAGESATLTLSVPSQTAAPSSPSHPEPVAKAPSPPNRTAAYVAFGVGSVGLVASALFAGLALSEKRSLDADPECVAKQCPPGYRDRESRMVTFADIATAGLVTLGVGAAAGTFFLLTASPSKAGTARVTPWFTGNAAGIAGRF